MGRGLAPPQIHQHNRVRRNQSAPIGNVVLIGFDGLPEALEQIKASNPTGGIERSTGQSEPPARRQEVGLPFVDLGSGGSGGSSDLPDDPDAEPVRVVVT
jgi:hypothetical protein